MNSVINEIGNKNWSLMLDLPSGISKNERSQIEEILPKFIDLFKNCGVEFENILKLKKPIKCIFVSPLLKMKNIDDDVSQLKYHPLILVSASDPSFDEKTFSWRYIQGAGDDHQTWGKGLTPELFWKFEIEIFEDESFIDDIVDQNNSNGNAEKLQNFVLKLTEIGSTKIFIGSSLSEITDDYSTVFCCVKCENRPKTSLYIEISDSKKNKSLEKNLKIALDFIEENLKNGMKIAIICESGNDESICVACATLVSFFDEESNRIDFD